MVRGPSITVLLSALESARGDYGDEARSKKQELLKALAGSETHNIRLLMRLHAAALFLRAFPDDADVHASAGNLLRSIAAMVSSAGVRKQRSLDDSGIAGTSLSYEFSYDLASWLAARYPSQVRIDWDAYDDPERLDTVLHPMLYHAEVHVWDEGEIGTQEWVELAIGDQEISDLVWLSRQIRRSGSKRRLLADLYDAAEVPLRWDLASASASKTLNEISWLAKPGVREGWRKAPRDFRREICRPVRGIKRVTSVKARDVIDAARAALAVRHREVYAMTYANPEEVYLAPVGQGVHVAVLGVLPEWRFNVDGNYGYVIFSHGVPIGYGGASPLFDQANTGVNILEEFRRGESRFLFLQVLRVFRSLFGCERFIANPYQFGEGNDEAFATGAFWFYHKLGFRPTKPNVRHLAQKTARDLHRQPTKRLERATMRKLISCDLELVVRPGKAAPRFEEEWLSTVAKAATTQLASEGPTDRGNAANALTTRIAAWLGTGNWQRWPAGERQALARLAPVLALVADETNWPASAKKACLELIRAKGGPQERVYIRKLARHQRLHEALASICRRTSF